MYSSPVSETERRKERITMAMFDGTLAAESYCNLQRKDDKWPFEYRAIELPATPDTSTVEVAQKPREPSITDAMIQAGAKVLNPIAFEEVDNDHLCDVVGARREARSEARKVIVAALSLSSTDRASEGQSLPASIEEIAQMIGVEFRNDPVATRHAAERVYNFLDARISVRAKTLARQATTSGLPHYEGQAVECDGGLHTVSVTSPTGNSNA